MSSKPLTREDILANADLPIDTMEVPRWGGTIAVKGCPTAHPRYVQYWSGGQREQPSAEEQRVRKYVGAAIMCALDVETHEPLFTWRDADTLREKHYNSVIMVAERSFQLAANTKDEDRMLVGRGLMRLADWAQKHQWSEDDQNQIADFINKLMADEEPAPEDGEAPKASTSSE